MEPAAWQLIVALVVVAAAVAVLARQFFRFVRGSGSRGCGSGGCGSCATDVPKDGTQARPLVSLNLSGPSNEISAPPRKKDA